MFQEPERDGLHLSTLGTAICRCETLPGWESSFPLPFL
jgi:hypothetical protein